MGATTARVQKESAEAEALVPTLMRRQFKAAAGYGDATAMQKIMAQLQKHQELCYCLLFNWTDPEDGDTPLIQACRNNHASIVELLLTFRPGITDPNKEAANAWTPLMLACQLGHVEIVRLLLKDEKMDVNKAPKDNVETEGTPLLWCRTEELRRLLLEHNPPAILSDAVLIKQFEEDWARRNAEEKERQRVEREALYKERAARMPPEGIGRQLVEAAKAGDMKRLRPLVKEWSGHDVLNYADPFDNGGFTPLLWSCARGHYKATELLLDTLGVDVGKANNTGNTPLLVASAYGHIKVAILLTGNPAVVASSINRASLDGNTPLSCAGKNDELRGILVRAGAIQ